MSSFPELFLIKKRLFCYKGWFQPTKYPIVLAIKTNRCTQQHARYAVQLSKQFMEGFKLIWTMWVQVIWIAAKYSGWRAQFRGALDGAQNLLVFVGIVGTLHHIRDDSLCQDWFLSLKYLWIFINRRATFLLKHRAPSCPHTKKFFCSDVCTGSQKLKYKSQRKDD